MTSSPPKMQDGGDPLCLTRVWHREDSGNVEGADRNDFFVPALQVIFYMDDVDTESHCFSIIPESVETKRNLPKTHTGSSGWGAQDRLRIEDARRRDTSTRSDPYLGGRLSVGELTRRTGRVDIYGRAGTAVIVQQLQLSLRLRQTHRGVRGTPFMCAIVNRSPSPHATRSSRRGKAWISFPSSLPSRPDDRQTVNPADADSRSAKSIERTRIMYIGTQVGCRHDTDIEVLSQLGVCTTWTRRRSEPWTEWSAEMLIRMRERFDRYGINLEMIHIPLSSGSAFSNPARRRVSRP